MISEGPGTYYYIVRAVLSVTVIELSSYLIMIKIANYLKDFSITLTQKQRTKTSWLISLIIAISTALFFSLYSLAFLLERLFR